MKVPCLLVTFFSSGLIFFQSSDPPPPDGRRPDTPPGFSIDEHLNLLIVMAILLGVIAALRWLKKGDSNY